jgi:hypothetical protein
MAAQEFEIKNGAENVMIKSIPGLGANKSYGHIII